MRKRKGKHLKFLIKFHPNTRRRFIAKCDDDDDDDNEENE
jgi:hypothetical protein